MVQAGCGTSEGIKDCPSERMQNSATPVRRCSGAVSQKQIFLPFFYSVIVMFDDIVECECVNVTFSEILNSF